MFIDKGVPNRGFSKKSYEKGSLQRLGVDLPVTRLVRDSKLRPPASES